MFRCCFKKRYLLVLDFFVLMLLAGGCVQETPFSLFGECQYSKAQKRLEPMIPKETHKDYVLYKVWHASSAFEGGNYYETETDLKVIRTDMEKIGDGKDVAAVAWAESSKPYRGDPYEKSMAHAYGGFLALRQADYESALASFRQALAADQETRTKKEECKEDFAVGHYFAALSYFLLAESDNAQVHLDKTAKYAGPSELFSIDSMNKSNVFLWIEAGCGPYKVMHGPGNSLCKCVKCPDPVEKIVLECDGQEIGKAAFLDDLFPEADAHGWGEMDSVRLGKGVAQEIVSQIPIVSAFGGLIHSEADIRVWNFLPGKIFVWSGSVAPGIHSLALRCYDVKGNHIPQYDQVWFHIPVSDGSAPNFMAFRIVPYRQDIKGKVLVPCRVLQKKS